MTLLPHADDAIVEEQKLTGYLLNPDHPRGKAGFFLALGYTAAAWQVLRADLLTLARTQPLRSQTASPYGTKYIIEGTLTGPAGRSARIRTVWIIEPPQPYPRLVTAHPLKGAAP
jgi:hypothetical protein